MVQQALTIVLVLVIVLGERGSSDLPQFENEHENEIRKFRPLCNQNRGQDNLVLAAIQKGNGRKGGNPARKTSRITR